MKNPIPPNTSITTRSQTWKFAWNAASASTANTNGTSMFGGTNATLASQGVNPSASPVASTLAITRLNTMVSVRSRFSASMDGPGCRPRTTRNPRKIAIPTLPGTPKKSVGMSCPPSTALLADSGAMTPRMSPVPNVVVPPRTVCRAEA